MAGAITAIKFQKRTSNRVNLYLDDAYAFSLPAIEAASLKKGDYLTDDQIQELVQLDRRARAYDRAVKFLARRPRSVWEVRRRLERPHRRRGSGREDADGAETERDAPLSPADIDAVVERLQGQGYLDDPAFVRYWVEQRNRFKPMAPRALRYELRNKGVANPVIDAVLQEEAIVVEDAALEAARSRAHRWAHLEEDQFQQKMARFLQRRGFGWDAVRAAVEQVWQESRSQ